MRIAKRLIAILIVLTLALALGGCDLSSKEDRITLLVQGNLDSLYLDKMSDDYLKLVGATAEECHQDYLDGLDVEADVFAHYFQIDDFTDAMRGEVIELYKQTYSHSKYTVEKASKVDGETYAVKVHISPIDIFERVYDRWDDAIAPVQEEYADKDMSDEATYAAYDAEWARTAIDLFRAELPNLGYLDEETILIRVEKNSGDYWTIVDADLQKIDELLISYP